MLIKCTIPRRDNSPVIGPDGKTLYHFKPDVAGNHVCDVTNAEHAKGFLAHTGIYVPADGNQVSKYDAMERDELAAMVEDIAGKKPHHKTSKDKLIETLLANDQDNEAGA